MSLVPLIVAHTCILPLDSPTVYALYCKPMVTSGERNIISSLSNYNYMHPPSSSVILTVLVPVLTITLVSVFAICRETINSSSAISMMESSRILIVPQASIAHLAKFTVIDDP